VETEALAGSIRASASDEEDHILTVRLLESEKDFGEHALVVDAIRRKLEAFCAELRMPARPRVRRLRSVLHLHTPMAGFLAHDRHVLELAAALHPTPSVGGVPTADATRWIAENEPAPRGWYSGLVGRFDAGGDGILVAAIRSALLRWATAHVYAGAGIVRDSDPDAEYEETSIKMRAMRSALGVLE
jgi:menaquinone-specific isochorismate synthase